MKKKNVILLIAAAIIVAAGVAAATLAIGRAKPSVATPEEQPAAAPEVQTAAPVNLLDHDCSYQEVNTDCKSYLLNFAINDDGVCLWEAGLYDIGFGYTGKPTDIKTDAGGVSFDCLLNPMEGTDGTKNVEAHFTLTPIPSGLYDLRIAFKNRPDDQLAQLEGTTTLFKQDRAGNMIEGSVPVRISDPVTIASLVKAVSAYVFYPQMLATRMYLKTHTGLSDTEMVTQDERNRFLAYSWGEEGACMDCKYWTTDDGDILLVVNFHDPTYEYPQTLKFFLFDPKAGTMRQLPRALADKWPLEDGSDNNGICYQVRYNSDGIVALVPQTAGDSFDIVTLKFDGRVFK